MIRYTGKGDWILDLFAGEGTSLIECKQWGRNGVGVELVPRVAARANQLIKAQENPRVFVEVVTGDSTSVRTKKRVKAILATHNISQVQLIILHPPYFNIIRFSNNSNDLSNAPSLQTYLQRLRQVVENFAELLEKRRYMILVIGDYYANGEYVPLAFETMRTIVNIGLFKLKGIVVKNIQGNRGKIGQEHLWRYRALKGGFYIFKHEYIFVFQKLR